MRKTKLLKHQQKLLALNLDWIPLLGETKAVRRQARRLKASHNVVSGKPAAALGLAYGVKAKNCWSMAELFASMYPKGTYACVFALNNDYWHVLACHEGVVLVHADRGYGSKEQALEAVNKFLTAYPALEIIIIEDTHDFYNRLLEKAGPAAQLVKIKNNYASYIFITTVLVFGVAWQFWPETTAMTLSNNSDELKSAWQLSLDTVLANNTLHGLAGTKKLLNNIQSQPLTLAGWIMKDIQCSPSIVFTQWLCLGEYRRQNINADNNGFIKKAPANWQIEFLSLDLAKTRWTIDLPAYLIKPELLPKSKIIESDWASELQYILPAFTELRLGTAQQINIPSPKMAGTAEIMVPADFPRLANRKLSVSGPLRSAVLLKKISDSIAWQKIFVRYMPGIKANTKASSLTIQLEGYVYENLS